MNNEISLAKHLIWHMDEMDPRGGVIDRIRGTGGKGLIE